MSEPQILLTNDDGILSPGLWAAAAALEEIGYVHVIAPREQSTGMGRSLPGTSDGTIQTRQVAVNGRTWKVYAVGGSPAQAVIHGILEILPEKPDLVVSGINYGENFGTGVTISGTVGAALEGAAADIPSLAVSLETDKIHHESYSEEIDFSAAAVFTVRFAAAVLQGDLPFDVDVLKLEIPSSATPDTAWELTRLARLQYYESLAPQRTDWLAPARLDYRPAPDLSIFPPDSDVYVTRVLKKVAVTPISLDMTSRIPLDQLHQDLKKWLGSP